MGLHTHPTFVDPYNASVATVKIFSPQDVISLFVAESNAAFNGKTYKDVYGIALSTMDNFAMKLLEPSGGIIVDWTQFIKDFEHEVNLLRDEDALTSLNQQKMFLKLFKKYGLDNKVALFKGSEDLSQWTRVTLVNDELSNTPCK